MRALHSLDMAWALSFSGIEGRHPNAFNLLGIASSYAADVIPLNLLVRDAEDQVFDNELFCRTEEE
jgi:hypothetical protein